MNGRGVAKDLVEAVKWHHKAAKQGHADAQFNLGMRFKNGQGVAKDPVEAVKWYRKAAEQGHADAQEQLERLTSESFITK
jgi:TPR repeat protein